MIRLLIAADILLAALFAWRFFYMPEQIPLFYSRPWGDPQIVDYWYIVILPIMMHMFYFLNIYFSKKYLKNEHFLRQLFRIVNICVIVVFCSIFIKIIFLVT